MPATSYKLAEVKDASNGQIHSTTLCRRLPQVFAVGGEKDVSVYQLSPELGSGKFNAKRLLQLQGHNSSINSLIFNDNDEESESTMLASGSFSGTIRTWDVEMGKAARSLAAGHKSAVTCLDFYRTPKYLLSGSLDTSVKFWDLRRRGAIGTYKHHRDRVTVVKYSPDGNWFITGGADNQMALIDMRTGKTIKSWTDNSDSSTLGGVNFIEFHHTDVMIANNFGKTINITELENYEIVSEIPKTSKMPRLGVFHPDKKCFFNIFEAGFETSAWEPAQKLEHFRCDWDFPVASCISEEDNALRVLSLAKNTVSFHTVNLSEVTVDRPKPELVDDSTFSPRKTFSRDQRLQNESNNSDNSNNSDVVEIVDEEPNVKVFGQLPARKKRNSGQNRLEPGEIKGQDDRSGIIKWPKMVAKCCPCRHVVTLSPSQNPNFKTPRQLRPTTQRPLPPNPANTPKIPPRQQLRSPRKTPPRHRRRALQIHQQQPHRH